MEPSNPTPLEIGKFFGEQKWNSVENLKNLSQSDRKIYSLIMSSFSKNIEINIDSSQVDHLIENLKTTDVKEKPSKLIQLISSLFKGILNQMGLRTSSSQLFKAGWDTFLDSSKFTNREKLEKIISSIEEKQVPPSASVNKFLGSLSDVTDPNVIKDFLIINKLNLISKGEFQTQPIVDKLMNKLNKMLAKDLENLKSVLDNFCNEEASEILSVAHNFAIGSKALIAFAADLKNPITMLSLSKTLVRDELNSEDLAEFPKKFPVLKSLSLCGFSEKEFDLIFLSELPELKNLTLDVDEIQKYIYPKEQLKLDILEFKFSKLTGGNRYKTQDYHRLSDNDLDKINVFASFKTLKLDHCFLTNKIISEILKRWPEAKLNLTDCLLESDFDISSDKIEMTNCKKEEIDDDD